MGDGDTDVAADGTVGEVALHAADGKLVAQVLEDGIGQAQVALGILEVDGIHLVGHSAGAHLAGFDALFEVLHGNVCPDIAAEVNQDDVDALAGVEPGCHHVIVLNLGGELLTLEAQVVGHKVVAEGTPVDIGEGCQMGVEIARGATELGGEGYALQLVELTAQTVGEHAPFLAQRGGRSGLSVGVGQHGDVLPLLGFGLQKGKDIAVGGQQHLVVALLHGEGHGGVVDVLRGEAEMDELLQLLKAHLVELALEEVFHGFDVVVGGLFDILDGLGIIVGELAVDVAQLLGFAGNSGQSGTLGLQSVGEGDEILHLDADTVFYQGTLGEVLGEGLAFGAIAPIDGRNGIETVHIIVLQCFVHKLVFLQYFLHLAVVAEVDEGLGVHGVVRVGAHELDPSALNHLVGALLGFVAIESTEGEDVGLEVDALVLELLHARSVDVEVGVALGVGKDDLVALHLHVENHLVASHHLLVQRELDEHILARDLEETGIVETLLEAAVDAVFASDARHLNLHTGIEGLLLQLLVAAADVVLVVLKAGGLEMGRDDHLVVSHSLEGVETLHTLLDALGAVVDLGNEVAMHVGAQGGEDGTGFIFTFEKAEHDVYCLVSVSYSTLLISAPRRIRRWSMCW